MKTKLHILAAIATTLGTPLALAQEERRPEPPHVRSPEGRRASAAPATRPLAFLGVATSPVPPVLAAQLGLPEGFGLVAEEVAADSPAEKAGVQRFDVLRLFNEQQLTDPGQLAALVRAQGKDAEVTLTLLRKGQEQKVTLRLTERAMPERRPGEMREQIERLKDGAGDGVRRMQEQARDLEKRLREYQERIKNWRGAPGEEMPKPPEFHPPAESAKGRRDERPRVPEAGRAATRSTANAKVQMKDDSGEIEVTSTDGRRHLLAKNAKGETVFDGPIDTPEQIRALPEDLRKKVESIDVKTRVETTTPQRPAERRQQE